MSRVLAVSADPCAIGRHSRTPKVRGHAPDTQQTMLTPTCSWANLQRKKAQMNTPKGWTKLQSYAVFIKGNRLIVLGELDSLEERHNCDEMGCGSLDHVIIRGSAHKIGITIRDAQLQLETESGGVQIDAQDNE